MELPGWIDEETVYHPMYWLLTIGAELAVLIGFKLQSGAGGLFDTGYEMKWYAKLLTVALIPVASYFITKKFRS